ncbi:dihydroneopterin aldolase [Nitrosophilus alvini]|uniref:dihydroneopterin aldolase n=1 Tax=Nitrosophilus alvini TaxID=2714855 RepID=UPI00190E32FB|nr:dihydroneopterin aldolase [Nitrosophilus alvini]
MKILINDLSFNAIIGVLERERVSPQRVIMDIEIEYDFKENYIDYAEVAKMVKKHIIEEKFKLIETALQSLAEKLKTEYPQIKNLKLTLKKPDILPDCSVGITFIKSYKNF